MATDVIEGPHVTADTSSDEVGFVDRLLILVDRLPGPAAFAYLAIAVALAVVAHLIIWATGTTPVGTLSPEVFVAPFILAWSLWLIHTLNRVAASSFDDFRPALGDPGSEARHLRKLTSIRDRDALLVGVVSAVVLVSIYYLFVRPPGGFMAAGIEFTAAPIWLLTTGALGILAMHTITQLRQVSHLSAIARNVDIFKPGPISAFSRLTAVSAIGLIAIAVAFVIYSPDQPIAYAVQEVALLALAAASFVLPLRVMHDRLSAEKKRLSADSADRLKSILAQLHQKIDSGDIDRSDQLNSAIASVITERDVIDKLRTWPWSTATIRGVVSALLLPIALIVLTQVIDKLI